MRSTLLLTALAVNALAAPTTSTHRSRRQEYTSSPARPQLKSATVMANVTNPDLDRDSCGSTRIGNRAFWTCRDTMRYDRAAGQNAFPVIANSAGWTDVSPDGLLAQTNTPVGPGSTGSNWISVMYGTNTADLQEYFPISEEDCGSNHGHCLDGTRWIVWPNSPPLAIEGNAGADTVAYSWIPKTQLRELTSLTPIPSYALYKSTWSASQPLNSLPSVSMVNPTFYPAGEPGYGDYGHLLANGYAYLYAQLPNYSGTLLARAPVATIEDKSTYEYFVGNGWTTTMPSLNTPEAIIPNAGTGWQGTFYYSTAFQSYIWIGQALGQPVADFYITTAPAPEGPWIEPYLLWQGENGDGFVGAYSLQAHTSLLPSGNLAEERGIWVTYTQNWNPETLANYVTPLVWLEFQ